MFSKAASVKQHMLQLKNLAPDTKKVESSAFRLERERSKFFKRWSILKMRRIKVKRIFWGEIFDGFIKEIGDHAYLSSTAEQIRAKHSLNSSIQTPAFSLR
jgi:hypothetical protein